MPDVDIVVPVHNEEKELEASVRRLHRFLRDGFPFSWCIVIADNASADATPAVAAALAADLFGVGVLRLERKGRGRALRSAWSVSPRGWPATWTSTSPRTCARCCRWSRRCCPATVDIVATALADLRGVARLAGGGVAERLAGVGGLVRLVADGVVAGFLAIGAASTLAFALLYVALHGLLGAAGANASAPALTAVGNTAANRRVTFRVRGPEGLWRHHAGGAAVFVLTLALTTGALTVLHALDPGPPRWLELGALVAATLTATVTRYVALRAWVFRAPLRTPARTRCAPSPRAGSTR